jgi:hypothetical protein
MWADVAVRGTIAGATVAWAAAEWIRWRQPAHQPRARLFWTVGAALTLAHVVAVFHYIHGWSHAAAVEHTARQTASLTRLSWGGGIWVNYAFIALWIGDALSWWRDRLSYEGRSALARDALLAVFVFMFVNAGIVFAQGTARAVGTAAVATALLARFNAVRAGAGTGRVRSSAA